MNVKMCTTSNCDVTEEQPLGENHQVCDILGQGGFGWVYKCFNINTGKMEAIKVFKRQRHSTYYAQKEIDILTALQCLDPDACNIVAWNGFFHHEDIICLNFELLDQSLWDYMVDNGCHSLPTTHIKHLIHELATTLDYMRAIEVIHADIKPMNIMVVDRHQHPIKIKLIDFGQAHLSCDATPGACVQTTWYTAPEVMLHAPYDAGIDMWSLGLIAAELIKGRPLYTGHTDYEVLKLLIQVQGRIPDSVLNEGLGTHLYFNKERFGWSFKTPLQFQSETNYRPRRRRLCFRGLDDFCKYLPRGKTNAKLRCLLLDLMKSMLHLDPTKRIKPREVLEHPFITTSYNDCHRRIHFRSGDKGAGTKQRTWSQSLSMCEWYSSLHGQF